MNAITIPAVIDGNSIRQARAALSRVGVKIEIAEANLLIGRIELRVSWDNGDGTGRCVTAMRSAFNRQTVIKSHVMVLRPGMYKHFWEIEDQISDVRMSDAKAALLSVFQRVADNNPRIDNEATHALGVMAQSFLSASNLLPA